MFWLRGVQDFWVKVPVASFTNPVSISALGTRLNIYSIFKHCVFDQISDQTLSSGHMLSEFIATEDDIYRGHAKNGKL